MAAEIVAGSLGLDLYRIDLSAVVSKYIGETEKNLERIFRAADQGDAVLLFDEADAIFGKRSEVRDARDRYANVEVAYLLQRLEIYEGLAVLTTNLRGNIDEAFVRRLDCVLEFPLPEEAERLQIWERARTARGAAGRRRRPDLPGAQVQTGRRPYPQHRAHGGVSGGRRPCSDRHEALRARHPPRVPEAGQVDCRIGFRAALQPAQGRHYRFVRSL